MNFGRLSLGLPLAVVLFIFAVIAMQGVKDVTQDAYNSMNCTNTSLPTGQRMTCIGVSWFPFLFFVLGGLGSLYYAFSDKPQEV